MNWLHPVQPLSLERDGGEAELRVKVPSTLCAEIVRERYGRDAEAILAEMTGTRTRLLFEVCARSGATPAAEAVPAGPEVSGATSEPKASVQGRLFEQRRRPTARESQEHHSRKERAPVGHGHGVGRTKETPLPPQGAQLKPDYTFDTFVEGDCNRLARRAALAIAERSADGRYNPFLVYGGVGLGKTHLVQAIGNRLREAAPDRRVAYVSSEQFTFQFVRAIQEGDVAAFSACYRDVDLLIVDDVQFFGGKEKTQEEFFHLFNSLHQHGRHIVLCADRPPSEIDGIEDRLLSRFQWGLSADVQAPDLETRIAILRRKAEAQGLDLDADVTEYIAHRIKINIRQLEGALARLSAFAKISDGPLDLSTVQPVLSDLVGQPTRRLTVEAIKRAVAGHYDLPVDMLSARDRRREIVTARQVAMYYSRKLTAKSLKSIGLHFGGRDHSTVIHAIDVVENRRETEPAFRQDLDTVRRAVESHR